MAQEVMPVAGDVSQPSAFCRLPLEIRDEIYTYVLAPGRVDMQVVQLKATVSPWIRSLWALRLDHDPPELSRDKENTRSNTSILRVSREISNEALDVLYGRSHFIIAIHEGTGAQLEKLGVTNLQRIRSLRLIAQFQAGFPSRLNFEPMLWAPLLSNLRNLCLVVQQPLKQRTHFGSPSLEQDICQWASWLDPVLQYLAANVPESTQIELDGGNKAETQELVHKHLGGRYRNVRADTGSGMFEEPTSLQHTAYMDSQDGAVSKVSWPYIRASQLSA